MADLPVDFTTPVGQVRALIPDIEILTNPNHPAEPAEFMFRDGHLTALISVCADNVMLAAAMACDILGSSDAIIAKAITTQDLVTDGPGMMKAFLARGAQLRAEALRLDNGEDFDTVASIFIWRFGYPFSGEAQMLGNPTYDGSYTPIWP